VAALNLPVPAEVASRYAFVIDVQAGPPLTYTVTATPTGAQAKDRCGALTINQAGNKTAAGPAAGRRPSCTSLPQPSRDGAGDARFTIIEMMIVICDHGDPDRVGSAGFVWLNQSPRSAHGVRPCGRPRLRAQRSGEAQRRRHRATPSATTAEGWQVVAGAQVLRSREAVGAQIGFASAPTH